MYTVVEEPIPAAVSLELAKAHLHVTHDTEDDLISSYIEGATRFVESYSGKRFIKRDIELVAGDWLTSYRLPSPLVAVVSAQADAVLVPVEQLTWTREGSLLWPDASPPLVPPLRLVITAGVADDVDTLPFFYRAAVLSALGHLYVNREGQDWPPGLMAQVRSIGGVRLR